MEGGLHKVVPNSLLSDEYPELVLIPTVHNVEITKIECIPCILLNLSEEAIFLRKGEILRHLGKCYVQLLSFVLVNSFACI